MNVKIPHRFPKEVYKLCLKVMALGMVLALDDLGVIHNQDELDKFENVFQDIMNGYQEEFAVDMTKEMNQELASRGYKLEM